MTGLFRYMDALDRIEGARRGPQGGLLDDEWFDTYLHGPAPPPTDGESGPGLSGPSSPGSTAPAVFGPTFPPFSPAGASSALGLFAPMPQRDPFNDWYRAEMQKAVSALVARLLGRSQLPAQIDLIMTPARRVGAPAATIGAAEKLLDRDPSSVVLRSLPAFVAPETPRPNDGLRDSSIDSGMQPQSGHPAPAESDFPWPELSLDGNIAENSARFYEWLGNTIGLDLAPKHLRHYREGTGTDIEIAREEARRLAPFRSAEAKNTTRFEDAFLRVDADRPPSKDVRASSAHGDKLLKLKDGESIAIEDHWDRNYDSLRKQIAGGYTPDFLAAFGQASLTSKGKFTATRHGDEIRITGEAIHSIDDRYDFNDGAFFHQEGKLLQQRGAKPFERKGAWKRQLTGTVRVKDGKLAEPNFVWKDVDR